MKKSRKIQISLIFFEWREKNVNAGAVGQNAIRSADELSPPTFCSLALYSDPKSQMP
jgi:hypothetical protein